MTRREAGPWTYAVEPGKQLGDYWLADDQGAYDLCAHGPNGFFRHYRGTVDAKGARPEVIAVYDKVRARLALSIENAGAAACTVTVRANAYSSAAPRVLRVAAGRSRVVHWDFSGSAGWYDVTVSSDAAGGFVCRLAGHIETGKPSTSDPLLGNNIVADAAPADASPHAQTVP